MNAERRKQLRAWYTDPVRKLPRKVVRDVIDLLDALEYGHCYGDSCAREQLELGPLDVDKALRQLAANSEVTRKRR